MNNQSIEAEELIKNLQLLISAMTVSDQNGDNKTDHKGCQSSNSIDT